MFVIRFIFFIELMACLILLIILYTELFQRTSNEFSLFIQGLMENHRVAITIFRRLIFIASQLCILEKVKYHCIESQ